MIGNLILALGLTFGVGANLAKPMPSSLQVQYTRSDVYDTPFYYLTETNLDLYTSAYNKYTNFYDYEGYYADSISGIDLLAASQRLNSGDYFMAVYIQTQTYNYISFRFMLNYTFFSNVQGFNDGFLVNYFEFLIYRTGGNNGNSTCGYYGLGPIFNIYNYYGTSFNVSGSGQNSSLTYSRLVSIPFEFAFDSYSNGDYITIRFGHLYNDDGSDYFDNYEKGYSQGQTNGYKDGYSTGYNEGQSTGYHNGYIDGQNAGMTMSQTNFMSLFASLVDTPIRMLYSLFNFDLFGTSMLIIILSTLTAIVVIKILKKFI